MLERIRIALLGLAGTLSTTLAGWLAFQLLEMGVEIDSAALQGGIYVVLTVAVFFIMQLLNRIAALEPVIKIIRFGASLPVYEHQAPALDAIVLKEEPITEADYEALEDGPKIVPDFTQADFEKALKEADDEAV